MLFYMEIKPKRKDETHKAYFERVGVSGEKVCKGGIMHRYRDCSEIDPKAMVHPFPYRYGENVKIKVGRGAWVECEAKDPQNMCQVCDRAYAIERWKGAKSALWDIFKESPLAGLLNEFGNRNESIAFHKFLVAGCKKCEIDELILWQPDKYLNSIKVCTIHHIASQFDYMGRVVNERGVPWIKPLYEMLEKEHVPKPTGELKEIQLRLF